MVITHRSSSIFRLLPLFVVWLLALPPFATAQTITSPARSDLDTGRAAAYMSELEKEVLFEINMVRANPTRYAELYLEPLQPLFDGKLLKRPGEVALRTQEGWQAVKECIKALRKATPAPPLQPAEGLWRAGRDLADEQGETGRLGHEGKDGSRVSQRIERYGSWSGTCAENISYGQQTARGIVLQLLIDDGVKSRGHRKNLLNPVFRYAGIAAGPHPKYGFLCVQDFAAGYTTKK